MYPDRGEPSLPAATTLPIGMKNMDSKTKNNTRYAQHSFLTLLLGLLIASLALWFSLRDIDLQILIDDITSIKLHWLLLAILIQVLALLARAQRWKSLMGIRKQYWLAFNVMNIGYLLNTILPLRLGEIARPILISARSDRNVFHAAATVVVERVLDIMMVVLVLLFSLSSMEVPDVIRSNALTASALVIISLSLLFLVVRYQSNVESIIQSSRSLIGDRISSWLSTILRKISVGFKDSASPLQFGIVFVWSIISWGLSITLNYCVMRAFTDAVNLVEAAFLIVPLTFSMTVPSSPGYVGVFELVGQQALVLPFGEKYPLSLAFNISLFIHTVFLVVTSAFGALGLMTMNLSLNQIRKTTDRGAITKKTEGQ